jgi:hypothetical protein
MLHNRAPSCTALHHSCRNYAETLYHRVPRCTVVHQSKGTCKAGVVGSNPTGGSLFEVKDLTSKREPVVKSALPQLRPFLIGPR